MGDDGRVVGSFVLPRTLLAGTFIRHPPLPTSLGLLSFMLELVVI